MPSTTLRSSDVLRNDHTHAGKRPSRRRATLLSLPTKQRLNIVCAMTNCISSLFELQTLSTLSSANECNKRRHNSTSLLKLDALQRMRRVRVVRRESSRTSQKPNKRSSADCAFGSVLSERNGGAMRGNSLSDDDKRTASTMSCPRERSLRPNGVFMANSVGLVCFGWISGVSTAPTTNARLCPSLLRLDCCLVRDIVDFAFLPMLLVSVMLLLLMMLLLLLLLLFSASSTTCFTPFDATAFQHTELKSSSSCSARADSFAKRLVAARVAVVSPPALIAAYMS
mmetsp:Transcript_615/g.888  ORF Transcript_615/g.888 Transcript_615/m.888 type:complete len:283 (-) Transcript_615:69-917(-)